MPESLLMILSLLLAGLRMATPMIFASMGGMMSERSGVVNIALEGFMLTGAFAAAVVAYYTHSEWLGWSFALRYKAGQLASAAAAARLGELSGGARLALVSMRDGRAAIDVDKAEDLALARRLISER